MICARCDKPIRPGEKTVPIDKDSNSGGGITIHVHDYLCRRPPTQTSPVSRRGLIRD